MKIKILTLSESARQEMLSSFRNGESHCFRMRCRAVLLKSEGLSSAYIGKQTEITVQSVNGWVKRFESEWFLGHIPVLDKDASPSWIARTQKYEKAKFKTNVRCIAKIPLLKLLAKIN